MPESDTPVPAVPDSTADPLAVLATLPKATQLLLRDYIAGLEAQAGSARALADHHERQRHREVNLLRMKLSGMRAERDEAREERDEAVRNLADETAGAQSNAIRRR